MKNLSFHFALLTTLLVAALPLVGATPQSTANPAAEVTGPYFGQKLPGKTPQLFAPGIVSIPGFSEMRIVFSPKGDECFFTRSAPNGSYPWKLYYAKSVNNVWTTPALAPFQPDKGNFTGQPFFAADGNQLYFTSNANGKADIWVVQRTPQGWGTPQVLPAPVTSDAADVYYSQTLDGTAYFASDRPGGKGELDVWRLRQANCQPAQAENLGSDINTSDYEYDPCIDPQGRYLLYVSPTGLCVRYSDGRGGWGKPIPMSTFIPELKEAWADGHSFSPDGKYFFWRQGDGEKADLYWIENPIPPFDPSLSVEKVIGPYFGQKSPGKTPRLFAPGFLMQPGGVVAVTRIIFSPDGNECFFSGPIDWNFSSTRMYYAECVNNVWTPPVLASFFPGKACRQPFFSADGNKLYFSSDKNGTSDIWVVERNSRGWGTPQVLPAPINTSSYDGMYTQTTDGTVYIESDRPGGQGGFDVWRISPPQPGQPQQIQNLGTPVNTGGDDNDPVVSPDGSYIIYGSNYDDLFVAFNKGKDGWTAPINMNQYCPGINTSEQEYAPSLSPDGRYLFFTRNSAGGVHWVENPLFKNTTNSVVNIKVERLSRGPHGETMMEEPEHQAWDYDCCEIDEKKLILF